MSDRLTEPLGVLAAQRYSESSCPPLRSIGTPRPSRRRYTPQAVLQRLLEPAGIQLDGPEPWDPEVRDPRLFLRVLFQGSLGLGEAYMEGWWECQRLDGFFDRVLRAGLGDVIPTWWGAVDRVRATLRNPAKKSRAFEIGRRHYDLGNDLFEAMLDRRLTYSCAFWAKATNLDEAQEAKLDLVCRKIGLRPGMRVLDIGSGWGGFATYAAERYGVEVVGITVSREQQRLASEGAAGLPVSFRLEDYRDLDEAFDAIVSIGMFEHVGPKNYDAYFDVIRRCLKPGGLILLHTIGSSRASSAGDPWISRYIFPNSHVPSAAELARALEGRFVIEDWHNFGADYDRTLMAWERNFRNALPMLRPRYGDRFCRMWRYYLLSCAGSFRSRYNQLWQVVLSPRGVDGGYVSIR